MKKTNQTEKVKLVNFPEEITEEGIKIYGETSYENQMAVLSQFLHLFKLLVYSPCNGIYYIIRHNFG